MGDGSTFRFTSVRRAPPPSARPAPTPRPAAQPSLRGKRVLVVDDNATNRRILAAHLAAWGMPARATESPREALGWGRGRRALRRRHPRHAHAGDGRRRAGARDPQRARPAAALPLMLFTSLGRREARAGDEGFAAYLTKPIKPSQLFDALASVLADQPVHARARRRARASSTRRWARRHPLRILLAEDNVVNQKVALRCSAQMGYRADVAANGLEAIEAVERQTYDVVLMDVQMPEMDGFEASREINPRAGRAARPGSSP